MPVQKKIECIRAAKSKAERTAMIVGLVGIAVFIADLCFSAAGGESPTLGFIAGLTAIAYWFGVDHGVESLPPDSEIILELLTEEEKPKA